MYVQSPCSTRSAVTLFLTSSRRRVVVRRTSCPVNLSIPPLPFQANIDPLRLDFNTPTPTPPSLAPISGRSTPQNMVALLEPSPPSSPSIVMDIAECYTTLASNFAGENFDIIKFSAKNSTLALAKLLVRYHEEYSVYTLRQNAHFCPCVGTTIYKTRTCIYFSIRVRMMKLNGVPLCQNCYSLRQNDNKKYNRSLIETKSGRLKPLSNVLHASAVHLLPSLNETRRKNSKSLYWYKSRNGILTTLLKAKKENMVIQNGRVKDVLIDAVKYIKDNIKASKSEILKVFMGLQFDNNPGESTTLEQDEYIDYIMETITNMGLKLKTHHKQCRFSPHVINTAMSLYLRSRKSYEELRNSGLLCLPDPRHLRQIGGDLKIAEGGDPMIYSLFQEEVQLRKRDNITEIVGHLMLDEVKLKNGIAYNCNSNEVTGFIPEHMDTKNVYQDILNNSTKRPDEDKSKKATV